MPYKLSASLAAHSSDVRAVVSPNNDLVLSASRDSTAIFWKRTSANQFANEAVYKASSRYVNAVAYLPPSETSPQGYIVAGSQDGVINIFSLSSPKQDPDFSLLGHSENVCALDVAWDGTIISGSWDRTAIVWKDFQPVYALKGHQQSVWAVLAIGEDKFLTASADKTIKLWEQHKMVQNFSGHTDAVRGLTLLPDIGFASCGNDGEIRVWTFGGDIIHILSGHTSFVYSLAVLPNGNIVSGGEDRSVRIWQDGECSQIITHPAISVWTVSTMPNSDLVSGCSDGMVRIFSCSEDRWASEGDIKEYEEQVARQALPSQQVGDVKKSDLPGPEALSHPGRKPGENKMIRNGDVVELHQWDSSSQNWKKIGDVVDAVGQGRRQLYQGKEYDYVFDVDIQDGVPPLKLPYNVTENPFSAAQRFLQANDLPLSYLDQVVQFIEKNTGGVNLGGGEDYQDPFTGASRYRSTGTSAPSVSQSQFMDPYTGASRYSGAPTATPSQPSSAYSDPFTGANRYTGPPTSAPAPAAPSETLSKILPVTKSISFRQANVAAMQSKLHQFNDALQIEISTSALAMFPEELQTMDDTFAYLTEAMSNSPPPNPLTENNVETVITILDRWPSSQLFPVIDLSRLIAGFCPEAFETSSVKSRYLAALLKAAEWNSPWAIPLPKSRETNILLLFRSIANLFQEKTRLGDGLWISEVLDALGEAPYTTLAKSHRVPLATILFNISCVGLHSNLQPNLLSQLLTLMNAILGVETVDVEAVYRTLVGLGNVVHASKTHINIAQAYDLTQTLQILPSRFPDSRIRGVVQEILGLLL